MSSRTVECYAKVGKLMDELENLTEWEYDFVMKMADFEEAGRLFTFEQMEKIEQIYEERCE